MSTESKDAVTDERKALLGRLKEPFEPHEIRWKPQAIKNNRALAIAYLDARAVMDRLDDVFGVGEWSTSYRPTDGGIICALSARVLGEWVTHEDVGGFSEQDDEGDRTKAAFSDGLKRAAIHFGIGRYVYRLPHQWVDWNVDKKQFVQTPQLPAFALPKSAKQTTAKPAPKQFEDAALVDQFGDGIDGTTTRHELEQLWKDRVEPAFKRGELSPAGRDHLLGRAKDKTATFPTA